MDYVKARETLEQTRATDFYYNNHSAARPPYPLNSTIEYLK